jgi:hypothetical protein
MSPNTHSSLPSVLLFAFSTLAAAAAPVAPPLPAAVSALVPDAKVRGGGSLTFFGLHIYDGFYYTGAGRGGWHPDDPFALQLVYRRHLVGKKIAERSVEEITKLGYGTGDQRARWSEEMRRMFPDVVAGDHLTGVNVPNAGVRFFYNGRPIGAIDDPEFGKAFFAMWLDPRTSEPALRKELLGERR